MKCALTGDGLDSSGKGGRDETGSPKRSIFCISTVCALGYSGVSLLGRCVCARTCVALKIGSV